MYEDFKIAPPNLKSVKSHIIPMNTSTMKQLHTQWNYLLDCSRFSSLDRVSKGSKQKLMRDRIGASGTTWLSPYCSPLDSQVFMDLKPGFRGQPKVEDRAVTWYHLWFIFHFFRAVRETEIFAACIFHCKWSVSFRWWCLHDNGSNDQVMMRVSPLF